jgi:hypothetical protein
MDVDSSASAWRHLEEHTRLLFPALKDVKVTHRWGGPFSVTLDLTPALGFLGDRRAVYSLGCMGHGVSTTHQNAITLADLLLERKTENTACPFVNRRVIPWPPEPLRSVAAHAIRRLFAPGRLLRYDVRHRKIRLAVAIEVRHNRRQSLRGQRDVSDGAPELPISQSRQDPDHRGRQRIVAARHHQVENAISSCQPARTSRRR